MEFALPLPVFQYLWTVSITDFIVLQIILFFCYSKSPVSSTASLTFFPYMLAPVGSRISSLYTARKNVSRTDADCKLKFGDAVICSHYVRSIELSNSHLVLLFAASHEKNVNEGGHILQCVLSKCACRFNIRFTRFH